MAIDSVSVTSPHHEAQLGTRSLRVCVRVRVCVCGRDVDEKRTDLNASGLGGFVEQRAVEVVGQRLHAAALPGLPQEARRVERHRLEEQHETHLRFFFSKERTPIARFRQSITTLESDANPCVGRKRLRRTQTFASDAHFCVGRKRLRRTQWRAWFLLEECRHVPIGSSGGTFRRHRRRRGRRGTTASRS